MPWTMPKGLRVRVATKVDQIISELQAEIDEKAGDLRLTQDESVDIYLALQKHCQDFAREITREMDQYEWVK